MGFKVRVMNLLDLDSEAAYDLVLSRRPDRDKIIENETQRTALKQICEIMGNHPLALELCASYLQGGFVDPKDLLEDLEEGNPVDYMSSSTEFQELRLAGEATLLQMLSKNYHKLEPGIVESYFLLMCCFAPYGINTGLIINAYDDPGGGRRALGELAKYSLIHRENYGENNDRTYLHPLVAQYGRSLEKTKSKDYSKKFVEVVAGFLEKHKDDLTSEKVHKELAHINEARELSFGAGFWGLSADLHEYSAKIVKGVDTQIDMLERTYKIISDHIPDKKRQLPELRVRLGKARRKKGQAKDALEEFEIAETLYAAFPKVDPKDKASLQFEIGDAHLAMGKYKFAREKLELALGYAVDEAFLDMQAPVVTQINQALARLDLFLGNYERSRKKI